MTIGFLTLLLFFFGYGGYLRYHAPKQIGHWSGFRSAKARKSQTNWDMAQQIISRYLYRLAILTVGMLILSRFGPVEFNQTVQFLLMMVPVLALLYSLTRVSGQLPD